MNYSMFQWDNVEKTDYENDIGNLEDDVLNNKNFEILCLYGDCEEESDDLDEMQFSYNLETALQAIRDNQRQQWILEH